MNVLSHLVSNLGVQQKQKLMYWGCIASVSIVLCVVVWNIAFADGRQGSVNAPAPTVKILTGASRLNPQDAWNERITNQMQTQETEIKGLKQVISTLTETLTKQVTKVEKNSAFTLPVSQKGEHESDALNQSSGQHGDNLLNGTVLSVALPGSEMEKNSVGHTNDTEQAKKQFRSNGISKQLISLQNSKIGKHLDTVDNTIPPGSFAQGILLSGVDAATSTSASANPEPVLIELTDSGDLSRYFTSTVKGCRVTASSYGVLSKERVMMRLEKLSCIEVQTGEVMVADVDGYVSGEDGKLGLRRTVVDRAGDHVRAAMVGGFLSSFGNFLAGASNPVTFAPNTGLAQVGQTSNADMLKHGGAKGVSGALDKYTEFYIKRAEQLEPIIQVGAGRVVQVVFSKSVGIGKSAIKHAISTKNDRVRTETLERHTGE
jgi:conjugal transfer pilus assembly protein TraB